MNDNKTKIDDGMTGMTMSNPDWYFLKQELPVLLVKSKLDDESIDAMMDIVYMAQHNAIQSQE